MSSRRRIAALVRATVVVAISFAMLLEPSVSSAETPDIELVSVSHVGGAVSDDTYPVDVSGSGRFVLFWSAADNLVAGDRNGKVDVFVRDRLAATTERVSVSTAGAEANNDSFPSAITDDGRFVVFSSMATNLVVGDVNNESDGFIHDRSTGTTSRILGPGGIELAQGSLPYDISSDGRFVALKVDPDDVGFSTSEVPSVAILDRDSDAFQYASPSFDGTAAKWGHTNLTISGDGSRVAFLSGADNLVANDTNLEWDVFVYEAGSGRVERVNVSPGGDEASGGVHDGTGILGATLSPSISSNGRFVVYQSYASNLVSSDTNLARDIFVRDLVTMETRRVSVAADGSEADVSWGDSWEADSTVPWISADGSVVVFESVADNLVIGEYGQQGTRPQVFVYLVESGVTMRLDAGTGRVADPIVSADAEWLVFRAQTGPPPPGRGDPLFNIFVVPIGSLREPGRFWDDDDSVFEADIEWMAAAGITKGCNPPTNDLFCPDSVVTRGQMAAFLVRALGLTAGLDDPFVDDDASIFEADIERLAAAGITKGCNPPVNDLFCPDSKVTREQMAAFLVRALGYTDPGAGDLFIDDDLSIFEADIDRLATAGVTKGCNPPTNDKFCPTGYVTRGQMAAFLHRALG